MTIKMIASRPHYLKAEGREVQAGEEFNAVDEREADILQRRGRARRASPKVTRALKARAPRARPEGPAVGAASEGGPAPQPATDLLSEQGQYGRRDMRPED